jgi:hypothetical protein
MNKKNAFQLTLFKTLAFVVAQSFLVGKEAVGCSLFAARRASSRRILAVDIAHQNATQARQTKPPRLSSSFVCIVCPLGLVHPWVMFSFIDQGGHKDGWRSNAGTG